MIKKEEYWLPLSDSMLMDNYFIGGDEWTAIKIETVGMFGVELDEDIARQWLEDNKIACVIKCIVPSYIIWFVCAEDAMAFKLRFGLG